MIDYTGMLKKQSIHSHLSASRRLGLIARYRYSYCSICVDSLSIHFFILYSTGGASLLAKYYLTNRLEVRKYVSLARQASSLAL